MANKLTFSSELMQNYLQASVMSPSNQFHALETQSGLSLLFSIGTDHKFYVTEETSQQSTTGWKELDLSSARVKADFSGKTDISCNDFSVAQNIVDGSIGLAMVLNDKVNDHLYLSLKNSNTDTQWLSSPDWQSFPFDASGAKPATIQISNVFISETQQGQFIIVDIVKDPASPAKLISRYYIDTQKKGGVAWKAHDISIDLESDGYQSVVGRSAGREQIDGLYTVGKVDSDAQFIYQPVYNLFNPEEPAHIARLRLPANILPDAVATARNSDETTDLFCAAGNTLYYFAGANQKDEATGVKLLEHELFQGISRLYAYKTKSTLTIWGLNQANQVFYVTCPSNQISSTGDWSIPLPILEEVDLISPYINLADAGQTFFGVAGNNLFKMVKSPNTSLWKRQSITLPPPSSNTPATSFHSYTTRIQLTDANDFPLADTELTISANSRSNFIVNNLYTVLDSSPITVKTDSMGSLAVIEQVTDPQGIQLTVANSNGTSISINPMDKPMGKVAKLNTPAGLSNAKVHNFNGKPAGNLVSPSVSTDDLKTVAKVNSNISLAYIKLTNKPGASSNAKSPQGAAPSSKVISQKDLSNALAVDAGDLFHWLESGVEHVVDFVKDAAEDVWHFVVKIAGKVYSAVMDCVEKVIGAVKWIFNAIKTAIEDVLKFLSYLFEWEDFKRTKEVLANLIKIDVRRQVNQLETWKQDFDGEMTKVINSIDQWAGSSDWTSKIGANGASGFNQTSKPAHGQTAPGGLLSHHVHHNISNSAYNDNTKQNPSEITALINKIDNNQTIIGKNRHQFANAFNGIESMSLEDALKKIIGFVADEVLTGVKDIVDELFDILIDIAEGAVDLLETPIYIPIVSDILKDLGIGSFSFLDIVCWVAALPSTIIYKAAKGSAPFPDNSATHCLINVSDYTALSQKFNQPGAKPKTAQAGAASTTESLAVAPNSSEAISNVGSGSDGGEKRIADGDEVLLDALNTPIVKEVLFDVGNVAIGCSFFFAGALSTVDAALPPGNPVSRPASLFRICPAILNGVIGKLVPKDPIQNTTVSIVKDVLMGLRGLNTICTRNRATKAKLDMVLVVGSLVCSGWHIYELCGEDDTKERTLAFMNEAANITSYVGRGCYDVAVNGGDNPWVLLVILGGFTVTSGLHIAETVVEVA